MTLTKKQIDKAFGVFSDRGFVKAYKFASEAEREVIRAKKSGLKYSYREIEVITSLKE